MLVSCEYGHVRVNCMTIFSSILTDGGICCIFNGLHRKFIMHSEKLKITIFRFDVLCNFKQNLLFFSSQTDELDHHGHRQNMANNWTPEKGFVDQKLKQNRNAYPRAGLGLFYLNIGICFAFHHCN